MSSSKPFLGCAIASVAFVLGLLPGLAAADVNSVYAPEPEARGFASSAGGWASSSSFESCALAVTCPTVTNSFQATGGAGGEGYIRSGFSGVLGVVGSATATWQSPPFAYSGAGGGAPSALSLALSRRSDVGDLLGGGASTTYTAELVDVTEGGAIVPAVAPAPLAGADAWTTAPAAVLDPGLLTLGHSYAIRISSTYTPGTLGLLVSGNADFDDVVLTATRPDDPPGPGPDPGNDEGNGDAAGGGSAGALSPEELLTSVRRGAPETAKLYGKRVFVRISCPRRAGRVCRIVVQGRIRRHVAVTRRKAVRIAPGKLRLVALRVKSRFRPRVATRKRLLIVQQVRVGKVRATFARSRALIRR